MDIITGAVEKGQAVDIVYLDFAKAFDRVDHGLLLHKLDKHFDLGPRLLAWVRGFLLDRRQRVVLANSCSEWSEVTSGVPQGSVL